MSAQQLALLETAPAVEASPPATEPEPPLQIEDLDDGLGEGSHKAPSEAGDDAEALAAADEAAVGVEVDLDGEVAIIDRDYLHWEKGIRAKELELAVRHAADYVAMGEAHDFAKGKDPTAHKAAYLRRFKDASERRDKHRLAYARGRAKARLARAKTNAARKEVEGPQKALEKRVRASIAKDVAKKAKAAYEAAFRAIAEDASLSEEEMRAKALQTWMDALTGTTGIEPLD
jgi:hypothetical protein